MIIYVIEKGKPEEIMIPLDENYRYSLVQDILVQFSSTKT
jgi:hypothetical protein